MIRSLTCAALALLPALASSARAQPALEETIVVTATAAPESLGNVGRALTLVTREDIAHLPIASIDELFRLVPSVEVRARGPRGVQADFTIRGAQFGQALVLVNGIRLNDAQSGHHNGDIPVSLDDVERVEVLLGSGSSLHGADAFGGAINVITRTAGPRFFADVSAGQHDLVEAASAFGIARGTVSHRFTGEFDRSSGFMPARDHDVKLARYQGALSQATSVSLAYLDKEFGANGFYGPAPSREWTDQVLATVDRRLSEGGAWQGSVDGSYRTHGDRFIYDVRTPSLSQNTHRTHAVAANTRWHHPVSASTSLSIGGGLGYDAIRSSNLGDRDFGRGSAFGELRQEMRGRTLVTAGLRFDAYSRFGQAVSPSVSVSTWPADRVKFRASSGRAFRVPTFTELYYRDPNHEATGELDPERAWSVDGGLDVFAAGWVASASAFGRWEKNVIDWVRAVPTERWHTTNIRDVRAHGVEVGGRRRLASGFQAGVGYTWIDSEADALDQLSKYVLDYAPHSLSASASAAWRVLALGTRVDFKRRANGRHYWVVDTRIGRRINRVEVYADVANLLDSAYQEVGGVDMPGRWFKLGLRIR
jgi:outer membrane cobalamin receptor